MEAVITLHCAVGLHADKVRRGPMERREFLARATAPGMAGFLAAIVHPSFDEQV